LETLGLPIIITEYGTVNSSGGGPVDQASSNAWWTFNDQYKLSYVNWAVYANAGDAAIVLPGTKFDQLADPTKFAPSGVVVNQKYQATNQGVTCSGRK
jgi:endoglucanase